MKDNIKNLFEQGKILARAMEDPSIYRQSKTNKIYCDFSGIVAEMNEAKTKGKDCASTTLLLSGEHIPTYKALGFLIDSEKADLVHIAEKDSGSFGETAKGDFYAFGESLTSLDELSEQIRAENGKHTMNEVNVNIKDNAYVGIFTSTDNRSVALGIILQKLSEIHSGKTLSLYMYEQQKGQLTSLDFNIEQKRNIIKDCIDKKRIASEDIYYEIDGKEFHFNILEELENKKTILESAIEAGEVSIRSGMLKNEVKLFKDIEKGIGENKRGKEGEVK